MYSVIVWYDWCDILASYDCYLLYYILGLNALQLLNAAAGGSAPNPSSLPNSYGSSCYVISDYILLLSFPLCCVTC